MKIEHSHLKDILKAQKLVLKKYIKQMVLVFLLKGISWSVLENFLHTERISNINDKKILAY